MLVAFYAWRSIATGRADASGLALYVAIAFVASGVVVGAMARRGVVGVTLGAGVIAPSLLLVLAQSANAGRIESDAKTTRGMRNLALIAVCAAFVVLVAREGLYATLALRATYATLPPFPSGAEPPAWTPESIRTEDHRWRAASPECVFASGYKTRVGDVVVAGVRYYGSGLRLVFGYDTLHVVPLRSPASGLACDGWQPGRAVGRGPILVVVEPRAVRLQVGADVRRFVRDGGEYRLASSWNAALDDLRHTPWVLGCAAFACVVAAWLALRARRLLHGLREVEGWEEGELSNGRVARVGGGLLMARLEDRTRTGTVIFPVPSAQPPTAPYRGEETPTVTRLLPTSKAWLTGTLPRVVDAVTAWALILASAALAIALPVVMTAR